VVRVAGSEVVAVGTVFAVRLTPQGPGMGDALAVTLIEGQVSVRAAAGGAAGEVSPAQPLLMSPGERVRLAKAPGGAARATQEVDRPRLDQVVAWKRSEALFDNASLAEAVAEMNRYSRTPIVLTDDLAGAGWRISGQYRAGDNAGFARAVAAVHGLVVREGQGRLELARGP
jgi:transmembrane sensor